MSNIKTLDAIRLPINDPKNKTTVKKILETISYISKELYPRNIFIAQDNPSLMYDGLVVERFDFKKISMYSIITEKLNKVPVIETDFSVLSEYDFLFFMTKEDTIFAKKHKPNSSVYDDLLKVEIKNFLLNEKVNYVLCINFDTEKIESNKRLIQQRKEAKKGSVSFEKEQYLKNKKDLYTGSRNISAYYFVRSLNDSQFRKLDVNELKKGMTILDDKDSVFSRIVDIDKNEEGYRIYLKKEKLFISGEQDKLVYLRIRLKDGYDQGQYFVINNVNFNFDLYDVYEYATKLSNKQIELMKKDQSKVKQFKVMSELFIDAFKTISNIDISDNDDLIEKLEGIGFRMSNEEEDKIEYLMNPKTSSQIRSELETKPFVKQEYRFRDASGYIIDLAKYLIKKYQDVQIPDILTSKFETLIDVYNDKVKEISEKIKEHADKQDYKKVEEYTDMFKYDLNRQSIFDLIEKLGNKDSYNIVEYQRALTMEGSIKQIDNKIRKIEALT